jgi:multicomponent Na+:H+ antiporter subunit C
MTSVESIYLLAASALFGAGVYGVLVAGHLLRKILALNVLGMAVFLLLVTLGRPGAEVLDPVPQALVLTGIVVAVSATAFALALLLALYRRSGSADLDTSGDDEGDGG